MLVTLLPFFLAAHVAFDASQPQSEWMMYGPECTYDVLVNMSLANIVQENDNFCAMIATDLRCRPKGHDSLSCHFQNSMIKRPDPEDDRCSNAKDFVPTKYKFVGEEPFEIRFNPRGIENLIVHRTIPRWKLDMIKVIVSQLNIGFEIHEHRDKFTIMENSTVGHCEVDVRINRGDPTSVDDDSTEDKNFSIGFMSSTDELIRLPGGGFKVEKVRQPKKCPRRTIYFFGNHEDYSRDYFCEPHYDFEKSVRVLHRIRGCDEDDEHVASYATSPKYKLKIKTCRTCSDHASGDPKSSLDQPVCIFESPCYTGRAVIPKNSAYRWKPTRPVLR